MFDINSLLIENSISMNEDGEYVTEYKVDSAKKEKLIDLVLKKLSSAVNKNKNISKYCKICSKGNLDRYNTTLFNKLMKKNMYQSKLKHIFIGEYDFGNTVMKDNYDEIREIVSDVNSALPEGEGVKLYIQSTITASGYSSSIYSAGMFCIKFKKDAIKESSILTEGTAFSDAIMESLFGENDAEYITEWSLNAKEKKIAEDAIKLLNKTIAKSIYKNNVNVTRATDIAYANIPLKVKTYKYKGVSVANFNIPIKSNNIEKSIEKLDEILNKINDDILPNAKFTITNARFGTIKGDNKMYCLGNIKLVFTSRGAITW